MFWQPLYRHPANSSDDTQTQIARKGPPPSVDIRTPKTCKHWEFAPDCGLSSFFYLVADEKSGDAKTGLLTHSSFRPSSFLTPSRS